MLKENSVLRRLLLGSWKPCLPSVITFCRSFFQQLVVAADFCHIMGIPVRDLRPHNLLLLEPNDAPSLCRCTHMSKLAARILVSGWPVRHFKRCRLAMTSYKGTNTMM